MEIVTLDELKSLPLWRTRIRVVTEHTHIDNEYIESIEGVMGQISWGSDGFSVCIGGKGWGGEGRWVSVKSGHHRKVTVFLL